jgi:hypothetical protein
MVTVSMWYTTIIIVLDDLEQWLHYFIYLSIYSLLRVELKAFLTLSKSFVTEKDAINEWEGKEIWIDRKVLCKYRI